jgi:hypothetical protein
MTDRNHKKWKHAKEIRGLERIAQAQRNGYLGPDEELEDGYIHIPEEPDRKWTDKPMTPKETA